jgi:hypothetical protein
MAKAIADYLGVRDSRPTPDLIFDEEAMPQNTSSTSDAFDVGKTQLSMEVVVYVDTAIALADTKVFTVKYLYGDSYASSETIYSVTASGATAIAKGELVRFAPPTDFPVTAKLELETDDAAVTGAITAWPEYIAR